MGAVGFRNRGKHNTYIHALGRGKVDILNHNRIGGGVKVNNRERLLASITSGVELDAVATVHGNQITSFPFRPGMVGTANKIDS